MFIYVLDKEIADLMEKAGFKKMLYASDNTKSAFIPDDKIKFDFSKVDSTKIIFSNKLNF